VSTTVKKQTRPASPDESFFGELRKGDLGCTLDFLFFLFLPPVELFTESVHVSRVFAQFPLKREKDSRQEARLLARSPVLALLRRGGEGGPGWRRGCWRRVILQPGREGSRGLRSSPSRRGRRTAIALSMAARQESVGGAVSQPQKRENDPSFGGDAFAGNVFEQWGQKATVFELSKVVRLFELVVGVYSEFAAPAVKRKGTNVITLRQISTKRVVEVVLNHKSTMKHTLTFIKKDDLAPPHTQDPNQPPESSPPPQTRR
jgi:hypothetical protein